MKKPYLIDGEPADMDDIIDLAKKHGYEGYGIVFTTSAAARVLRENGYKVEENTLNSLTEGKKK